MSSSASSVAAPSSGPTLLCNTADFLDLFVVRKEGMAATGAGSVGVSGCIALTSLAS